VAAVVLAVALIGVAETRPSIAYRLDEVRGKVILESDHGSLQVKDVADAKGGDVVRTGWRGRAMVSADAVASRFEVFSGSHVRLASERPGVIVVLERGRLKAMFDAVTGNDERIVETPGALLAVRGTRYGVEVGADGEAVVSVFEGMVEVRPLDPALQPMLVRPGEAWRFGPRAAPRMVREGMTEKTWNDHGGSRAMPGEMGSPGSKEPGQMPDGRSPGMTGDNTRPQPSSGGTKKPH
jgi:hypothetical protein